MGDRPRCYNRAPYSGRWVLTNKLKYQRIPWRLKPVYRWVPHVMSDECKAWDAGPSPVSESAPARQGWNCAGCRWLPDAAEAHLQRQRSEGMPNYSGMLLTEAIAKGFIRPYSMFPWCDGPGEFKHEQRDIAGPVMQIRQDVQATMIELVQTAECQIRTSPPESKL